MLVFTVLLIPFSSEAASSAAEGMRLFFTFVAPALFPFMVYAQYLIKSGVSFHKPEKTNSFAFVFCSILTAVCGTPSAAVICDKEYSSGSLDAKEASILCAAINQVGPIFIISAVSGGFLKNRSFALPLSLAHYIPALLTAAALGIAKGKTMNNKAENAPAAFSGNQLTILSAAISDASIMLIRAGGAVVFFKILHGIVFKLIPDGAIPLKLQGFLTGLLEITNGLKLLSSSPDRISVSLCAFLISFGGVCFYIQSAMVFEALSPVRYFAVKTALGTISAIAVYLVYPLIPNTVQVIAQVGGRSSAVFSPARASIMLCTGASAGVSILFSILFSRYVCKR